MDTSIHRIVVLLASLSSTQVPTRSTVDRNPDAEWTVHVVYAVPADYPDRKLDTNGKIAGSIELMQQWLEQQSGGQCHGGSRIRFDYYSQDTQQLLDITFLRLKRTESELTQAPQSLSSRLAAELAGAGLASLCKIYLIYYDGSHSECGEAQKPPEASANTALIALRAQSCSNETFGTPVDLPPCPHETLPYPIPIGTRELGTLHEIFHTLGAVDPRGAGASGCGHVGDPKDLMYGRAGDCSYGGDMEWNAASIDSSRSLYFDHGRRELVDIAASKFLIGNKKELPPGWPRAEVETLPCMEPPWPSLPSVVANGSATVELVNITEEFLQLYWYDKDKFVESFLLAAFDSAQLPTQTGHIWRAEGKNGDCRLTFMVTKPGLLRAVIR